MLPKRENQLVHLAREWGLMKKVIVVLGPAEPGAPELHRAVDAVASAISEIPGAVNVVGRVDNAKAMASAKVVARHAARLYRPIGKLLDSDEVRRRLSALKVRLAAPESMMTGEIELADPLGFGRDTLKRLSSQGKAMGAAVENGHILCLCWMHLK